MNLKGNQDEFGFAGTHEYTIVFAKSKAYASLGMLPLDEEECLDWEIDEVGYFKRGAGLKSTGVNAPREKRPNLFFPVFINSLDIVTIPTEDEVFPVYDKVTKSFNDEYIQQLNQKYKEKGFQAILPVTGNDYMSWRWSREKMENEIDEIIVVRTHNDITIYKKQRPQIGDLPSKKAKSLFYKPEYSSGNGKAEIASVLGESSFGYPKPLALIRDFIVLGCLKDSTILDFFAGSGTTLHAVMQINAEDGGKRTCILCTNNENGICENITYERNKRVIEGYTKPNGEYVEGLHNNNLRYYRTAFVGRSRSVQNMRRLVNLSTDMLCIKEDLYTVKEQFAGQKTHKGVFRFFDNGKKQMLVIYREEVIAELVPLIASTDYAEPIKVYVFSPSEDPWEAEFEDVADKVQLCALPQAIYNTYKRILPKPKDRNIAAEEQPTEPKQDNPGGLFDLAEEGGEA